MEEFEKMEYLSARRYGYAVFQRLLGDEPTAEALAAIDGEVLGAALEIVGVSTEDVVAFLEALASSDADALAGEYMRALVGPAALPAPPWESVYRDGRRVIMTKTTLDVRIAYREQGFIPAEYKRVPDDHIALELDFLAALAQKALEACEAGDKARVSELLSASEGFLAEHLNAWAGAFAADMAEFGKVPFYATVAKALAAFALADEARLKAWA